MAERLMSDLAMEESLQSEVIENYYTKISHMLYQTRKKIRTRLNLPLHMIWYGRRDHLVVDMNPLESIP